MSVERDLWRLVEPIHAVTYFSEPARAAFTAAGLRGFWRGYFAGRSAPLGPVGPEPVIATFYNFAPTMVRRALPDVWNLASPQSALAARVDGAVATLDGVLAGVSEADVIEASELLEHAVCALEPAGRVLGAVNAALPAYDRPLARLWQATTTLREHRGDGHVAALVAADLGPVEVLTLRCGLDLSREVMQPARGWTDDEWNAAQQRLVERGLLDEAGTGTRDGADLMASVETATDQAATAPVRALGRDAVTRLTGLLTPMADACLAILPAANPIGLKPRTTA